MATVCHIFNYMAEHHQGDPRPTARIGWNNRVQTVSIPVDFRFPKSVKEVFIRRDGESVILTPRPSDWSDFLASDLKASADFMAEVDRLPPQERSF
jgi:antitoxin VapB